MVIDTGKEPLVMETSMTRLQWAERTEAEGAEVPSDAAAAAGVRAGRRTGTTSDFRFH